jgi:hypothetical protein
MKYILVFFITVFLFNTDFAQNNESPKKVRLTFFVHGIMSIKPHLSFANFIRFMTDNVENTVYSETVQYMREDEFFFKNQAMQEPGLHKIDLNRIEKGYASGLVARLFNEIETLTNPCSDYENHYYNFGWHGLLSARIRYFEAIPLYKGILNEVEQFRAQGIEPEVRLIGYSHGGNLCLNLGAVRQNENFNNDLVINELILLGVPIQCETDFLVNDPIFKRVYQIYSRGDRIQKLDFFSTKRFFSRRVFKSRKYFTLPEKLTQVQLRMTRNVKSKCGKQLPHYNINEIPILSGKSSRLRDASPGHIELWFFSWTPSNYRPDFVIAPLPLVIFLPRLLKDLNETLSRAQCPNRKKPVIIDIRPEHEHMIIKNQKSWKNVTITEFFDQETMNRFAQMTEPYKPDNYTLEEYEYHIEMALDRAKTEYDQTHACHKGRHRRRTKEHHPHKTKPFIKSTLIS